MANISQDGPVRLILVDDDPLVLSSLRLYFSTPAAADIEIVGEADNGIDALALLENVGADVLMTDIHMPHMDGIELLRHVRELDTPPVFIAMTSLDEDETMLSILNLGGAGYILKSSRPEFIIDTVHQAVAGGTVVSPQPATRLMRHLPASDMSAGTGADTTSHTDSSTAGDAGMSERIGHLSASEERVLTLLCRGLSNAEIGRETGRSASAVKKTVSTLLARFGTESRVQLAVLAVEAGFHPDNPPA